MVAAKHDLKDRCLVEGRPLPLCSCSAASPLWWGGTGSTKAVSSDPAAGNQHWHLLATLAIELGGITDDVLSHYIRGSRSLGEGSERQNSALVELSLPSALPSFSWWCSLLLFRMWWCCVLSEARCTFPAHTQLWWLITNGKNDPPSSLGWFSLVQRGWPLYASLVLLETEGLFRRVALELHFV